MQRDIKNILKVVAGYYGLPANFYELETRKRPYPTARGMCIKIIREEYNVSFAELGKMFGGKDHTTILAALKTINDLLSYDKIFIRDYNELKKEIHFENAKEALKPILGDVIIA